MFATLHFSVNKDFFIMKAIERQNKFTKNITDDINAALLAIIIKQKYLPSTFENIS